MRICDENRRTCSLERYLEQSWKLMQDADGDSHNPYALVSAAVRRIQRPFPCLQQLPFLQSYCIHHHGYPWAGTHEQPLRQRRQQLLRHIQILHDHAFGHGPIGDDDVALMCGVPGNWYCLPSYYQEVRHHSFHFLGLSFHHQGLHLSTAYHL